MPTTGDTLLSLSRSATGHLLLVAPFIKVDALSRILQVVSPDTEVTIVTRWIAREIACGVSDLEIFDLAVKRGRCAVRLYPALHAKLYRSGTQCLVGSANITGAALGWTSFPNVEILVYANPSEEAIAVTEALLLSRSVYANREVVDALSEQVAALKKTLPPQELDRHTNVEDAHPGRLWLPQCSSPEYLFRVYRREGLEKLLASTVQTGQLDVEALNIIPGLSEEAFNRFVAAALEQVPVVRLIDELATNSLTDEQASHHIATNEPNLSYDALTHWQILKAWLRYFFPNRYRTRLTAEVFERGPILAGR